MQEEERIVARLTDGSTEQVWAVLDPDQHSFCFLRDFVLELIIKKRGFIHDKLGIESLSFEPPY